MSPRKPDSFSAQALAPVKRRHLAGEVFDHLARLIVSGELEPGSSLPPERELAARFEVSRLLVRQAVHRLADLGLVRVRQGGASLVGDPDACDHPEIGALLLRFGAADGPSLRALRERQLVGSLSMLLLAARRIRPPQLERLRELLAEAPAPGEPFDRLGEAFWTCIAEATDNPFFQRETRYWYRIAREVPRIGEREHLPQAQRLAAYRAVFERLEAGEGAVEVYRRLVEAALDLLESA